jgi:phosphatidate phosphatase APP1
MPEMTGKLQKERRISFMERLKNKILLWFRLTKDPVVKVYNGYGHKEQLIVYGHVLLLSPLPRKHFRHNFLRNTFSLLRLFMVKPFAGARVRLKWDNQTFESVTEVDGFYKIEWKPPKPVDPGWHQVSVELLNPLDDFRTTRAIGSGKVLVPHANEYSCISDIDDTFLISHSSNLRKRLYVLLTKNAHSRKPFEGVVNHYQQLAKAGVTPDQNAFFYVSSSEWNLYNYIEEFAQKNQMPQGIFLLSQMKKITEAWKTGMNKHATKFMRIARILEVYPNQKFILLGDDSQEDPKIYASVIQHFPTKVHAVYLRHVTTRNKTAVQEIVDKINSAGTPCCYFTHSSEALLHSKKIGLIV